MATINGTTGPDNIIVSEDTVTNIVNGLDGDDTIAGSAGNDLINGGNGVATSSREASLLDGLG
jgi:Ca2+-binding RTX toxin-like protein